MPDYNPLIGSRMRVPYLVNCLEPLQEASGIGE